MKRPRYQDSVSAFLIPGERRTCRVTNPDAVCDFISIHCHDRVWHSLRVSSRPQRVPIPPPLMSAGIKYADLHSLPAYNTSSTSRLKSLYSDVSRQKHSNPTSYRSTVHWWREVLQAVVLKHWLPQSPDTLVLHALPTLADSFRYEGAGKPLCLATVIVSSVDDLILKPKR